MKLDPPNLPEDETFSKDDVTSIVIGYQEKIHYLEERIRLLQNELFGRISEKRYPDDHRQLSIFEQPEADADKDSTPKTIVVAEHQRIRGRKPLPDHLPRIEVIHDIPEDQKVCACGAHLSRIGQDKCEKLDYVPAKVRVLRHIRYKYACKSCEGVEDDGPTVKNRSTAGGLDPQVKRHRRIAGPYCGVQICRWPAAVPTRKDICPHGHRIAPSQHGQLDNTGRPVLLADDRPAPSGFKKRPL